MVCVYCGSATSVTNSRLSKRNNSVWRRRKCTTCSSIFTTFEEADLSSVFMIERKNGKLEPFDRTLLLTSIYDCSKHLPKPAENANELTNTVVLKLLNKKSAILTRNDIIKATSLVLKNFNEVTAVQYAAFHKLSTS